MKSKADIEKEIKEYEDILDNASVPQDEKDFAKDEIADLKKELEKLGKQKAGNIHVVRPTPDAPKKQEFFRESGGKKNTEPKPSKKKEKRPHKKDKDTPSCDELIAAYEERQAQVKKSARKAKSRSVFSIIADKVQGAVSKAFKSVPHEEFKADPKGTIKDFEKLEAAATGFLESFKAILGDEYESAEVKTFESELGKLIASLKKKYAK